MSKFGEHWRDHHLRVAAAWDDLVAPDDIVLSPGDLSWATKPADFAADAAWLGQRPGTVVLIKGNHDYWWPKTRRRLAQLLPANSVALRKQGLRLGPVAIFGTRGGDFAPLTRYGDTRSQAEVDQALDKEAAELQTSIDHLAEIEQGLPPAALRLCLFHYPPFPPGSRSSRFSPLIAAGQADHVVYGHLHGDEVGAANVSGDIGGVSYHCASCDLIDFTPQLIAELP